MANKQGNSVPIVKPSVSTDSVASPSSMSYIKSFIPTPSSFTSTFSSMNSDNSTYTIIITLLLICIIVLLYFLYAAYYKDTTIHPYSLYREIDDGTVKCEKKLSKNDLTPKFSTDFTAMVWVKVDKSTFADKKTGLIKSNYYYHVFHKGDNFPTGSTICRCTSESSEEESLIMSSPTDISNSSNYDPITKLYSISNDLEKENINLTTYEGDNQNYIKVPAVKMTPALFICPDTNDAVFIIDVCKNNCDTYYKKAFFIRNIDVNKWVHLAIVNNNNAVEIYMNGNLIKNSVLNSLIKRNDTNKICFGEISQPTSDKGFIGTRANFLYSQKAYSQRDIQSIVQKTRLSNQYNEIESSVSTLNYYYKKFSASLSFANLFKTDETCF